MPTLRHDEVREELLAGLSAPGRRQLEAFASVYEARQVAARLAGLRAQAQLSQRDGQACRYRPSRPVTHRVGPYPAFSADPLAPARRRRGVTAARRQGRTCCKPSFGRHQALRHPHHQAGLAASDARQAASGGEG